MKFSEAKEKLKKIANGRYHSISYELAESHFGDQRSECRIYIHDGVNLSVSAKGKTFEECFNKLENAVEEIPDMEG